MPEDIRPFFWSLSSDRVFADPQIPVICGMINRGEVVLLSAPPFSGKSLIAAYMCAVICAGQPFFGLEVRQGQALYIAGERELETRRRIGAMIGAYPSVDVPVAGHLSSGRIDLRDEYGAQRAIETIREIERQTRMPVHLVVVDTLSRVAPNMDENSSKDVGVLVDALGAIAAAGPAVLALHHPSKNGTGPRGSTALVGAADAILGISSKANGIKTLRLVESNSGPTGASVSFQLTPATYTHSETGDTVEAVVPIPVAGSLLPAKLPQDAATMLLIIKKQEAPTTWEDVRKACEAEFTARTSGARRQAISNARKILKERGLIVEDGALVSVSDASVSVSNAIAADG